MEGREKNASPPDSGCVGSQPQVDLLFIAFEHQGRIGAAESEGIGQDMADIGRPGLPGDDIQPGTGRVQIVQVDGGRHLPVPDGQDGKNAFHRPGGAQQVAGHGLGAAHQQP